MRSRSILRNRKIQMATELVITPIPMTTMTASMMQQMHSPSIQMSGRMLITTALVTTKTISLVWLVLPVITISPLKTKSIRSRMRAVMLSRAH